MVTRWGRGVAEMVEESVLSDLPTNLADAKLPDAKAGQAMTHDWPTYDDFCSGRLGGISALQPTLFAGPLSTAWTRPQGAWETLQQQCLATHGGMSMLLDDFGGSAQNQHQYFSWMVSAPRALGVMQMVLAIPW